jgi:ABC-type transport system involved in multi-copper enzyme maturation permease subunit
MPSGFVPTWVTNWLTPIWLVSVGVLCGLLLLGLIWLVCAALSRLPVIGDPGIPPRTRNKVALGLAVVIALLMFVIPSWSEWRASQVSMESLTVHLVTSVLLGLLVALGLVHLTSRRAVQEVGLAVREGALWPIFLLAMAFSAFVLIGWVVVYRPLELLASVARTPSVGTSNYTFTIPATDFDALGAAADPPQHPIDVRFRPSELRTLVFDSTQTLTVDTVPGESVDLDPMFQVPGGEPLTWASTPDALPRFGATSMERLFVRNYGAEPATLRLTVVSQPTHPQVWTIVITAVATAALFLLYILQRTAMPRTSAVALSTLKSEVAQPLFTIMMSLGITALFLFLFVPYNTFGEDIKMLKDSGMTLIMVLCIIQAIWASSTSVSDEIEGRTALTVLSKPIGRRAFIIGKFLGIAWTVGVMFVVMGCWFLVWVSYKPIYDAKETAAELPIWQSCHYEMIGIVPGLVLAFMETLVLAALSVAISTRLPMLANFILCFTVYVLGHLTPLLVQSSAGQFEAVEFVANLLATVLPILDHFNIQAAVAAGVGVPPDYLGWSLVYCLIYGMIALLLALLLFEDRDLA